MAMKIISKIWNFLLDWAEKLNEHRSNNKMRGMY